MENVYEILSYLPIDDVEVNDYITPLLESAQVTYDKGQYQFSYFAVHLIFMTYIYSSVWKIGQFHKDNYENSLIFARPYNGCKVDFKKIKSVFEYSYLPEKDIFEFFALIGLDEGYIKSTKRLIDDRNNMAHATGKIAITSEEKFNNATTEILSVSESIHGKLSNTLRDWYRKELLHYAKNDLDEQFDSIKEYINNIFIENFSFSQNELCVCKDFGLSKLKNWKESKLSKEEIARIVEFHEAVENNYIERFGNE